ncbi:hypothetical protein D3C80_1102030 [compost metagenome]
MGARLCFTCFTRGNHFAVIRFLTGRDNHNLCGGRFFLTNAGQRGINRFLIVLGRLNGRFLVTFLTGDFVAFKTCLARFKACFCFGCAFIFKRNGVNLGLLLTEVLHQRNAARTHPGASATLDAVGQVVGLRFIVELTFAEPVQLLRQ